jgi:SAM-dependent methyltransferase
LTTSGKVICPICGGGGFDRFSDFTFGYWDDDGVRLQRRDYRYDLLECRVCRHVMMDHDYDAAFITKLYALPQSAERWTVEDIPPEAPYAEMIDFFGPERLPSAGLIVDFGCGPGFILGLLLDRHGVAAQRLLGIDFLPPQARFPVLGVNLNELQTAGPMACDGFSAAFCSHTLEHLPDPRSFLRELRLRAGPGARLYLEVPDHGLKDMAALELASLQSAQHIHYFTLRTLRLLAESCGWRVIRQDAGWFGFVPRARLVLQADEACEAGEATRAGDAHNAAIYTAAAAAVVGLADVGGDVALWGVGGDLLRLLDRSPRLRELFAAGRFIVADSAFAGRIYAGQTVRAPSELAGFHGRVALLPRPAKVRVAIRRAALELGLGADCLLDPYASGAAAGIGSEG